MDPKEKETLIGETILVQTKKSTGAIKSFLHQSHSTFLVRLPTEHTMHAMFTVSWNHKKEGCFHQAWM